MGVPIHKKLETSLARIQILRGETSQLIAFFDDSSMGSSCMGFVMKPTDVFESLARSGKFFVRFVDAKFAFPKSGGDDVSSEFVCLDIPEYPGERKHEHEHDDIMIGFDDEEGKKMTGYRYMLLQMPTDVPYLERDRFGAALPAAVGRFSRLGALRR